MNKEVIKDENSKFADSKIKVGSRSSSQLREPMEQ
jgi:hypothetical protein